MLPDCLVEAVEPRLLILVVVVRPVLVLVLPFAGFKTRLCEVLVRFRRLSVNLLKYVQLILRYGLSHLIIALDIFANRVEVLANGRMHRSPQV